MTEILAGLTDVATAVGSVFTLMTSNAFTAFLLSAAVATIAIGIFVAVKNAAR